MAYDALPFARGQTYFNGQTPSLTDGLNLEGKEFIIEDKWYSSGRPIKLKIVRNTSGVTLYPKFVVVFSTVANEFGRRVDGYVQGIAADYAGVVDELVTSVPANDLFYIVTEGPTIVKRSASNFAADIAVGARFIATTANATTGTTSNGRIIPQGVASTALTSDYVQNVIGRALSANASTWTGTDPLVLVGRR